MGGFSIMDAGLAPAALIALLAGVLSFLSPCVLPIVPPYLAYMGGISLSEARSGAHRRLILPAVMFVLGLSSVFVLLGLAASAFGAFFLEYQDIFTRVGGAVVILFGLHFLGVFRIALFQREARLDAGDQGGSAIGAYVLGLAFAFGWTPCIGPQLGAILTLAAQEGNVARGTLLLAIYAVGLGLPFLLAALFIERAVGVMARLKRHMRWIEAAMGLLLIIVGTLLVTGQFTSISFFLLDGFDRLGVPLLG